MDQDLYKSPIFLPMYLIFVTSEWWKALCLRFPITGRLLFGVFIAIVALPLLVLMYIAIFTFIIVALLLWRN